MTSLHEQQSLIHAKELLQPVGIRLGIPVLPPEISQRYAGVGWEQIAIPNMPHVFFAEKLQLNKRGSRYKELENVMVMLGHGFSRERSEWRFLGNNRDVMRTVFAYEDVAWMMDFPPVDVVLACRGDIRPPEYEEEGGPITVYPGRPIIIEPSRYSPHINPTSLVTITSVWRRDGNGVANINANAVDWQKVEVWERHLQKRNQERKAFEIPAWAKNIAR